MAPKKMKNEEKPGQKPSKAQKKRQMEEARRLREEEEARLLQAEREEQERLEKERKQREVEELEMKALEHREDELNELRHLLEEKHAAVTQWERDAEEAAEWERVLSCNDVIDSAEQRQVNTFITLWRDDPELDIRKVLEKCHVALQLIEELDALIKESTDPKQIHIYQEGLIHLQDLIQSKVNLTCEDIFKKANQNDDIKTGNFEFKTENMKTVVKDQMMTLCLWANLEKNPSFKGLTFEEVGLGFQLPEQLLWSDIAVQILHTHYDHLTTLSRTTHPRSHRSPAGNKDDPKESSVLKDDESLNAKEELQSIHRSEGPKTAGSDQLSRNSSAQAGGGRQSEIFTQMEALDVKVSAVLQLTRTPCDVQVVDLMEYSSLGGVFCCHLFHLPPQAKKAGSWTMQQTLSTGLEVFPYPSAKCTSEDPSPVGVSVTLSSSVVFFEPPLVARWDASDKQWRTDGITDISFKEAEAKISFKMETFLPFVLMQKTYINLPFQSWELQPLGPSLARFSINGPLFDLSITVQDSQCLLQLQGRPLPPVVGRWMSRPDLQKAMFNAGINIFVDENTDNYVPSLDKNPVVERATYEQMALCASSCAFSRSRWNAECGPERLVLQACEHHGPDPVPEDSWTLYLVGSPWSQKLELTESSPTFSSDHDPGSQFHSTLLHMLQDNMSPGGVAKTKQPHYLFVNTLQDLLWSTRPLNFSGPE